MAHTALQSWMGQYPNYAMQPFDLFHTLPAHALPSPSRASSIVKTLQASSMTMPLTLQQRRRQQTAMTKLTGDGQIFDPLGGVRCGMPLRSEEAAERPHTPISDPSHKYLICICHRLNLSSSPCRCACDS